MSTPVSGIGIQQQLERMRLAGYAAEFSLLASKTLPSADNISRAYNVIDHGVRGDGLADDSIAMQAILDAAGFSGGGAVYLPPGRVYLCLSGLRVQDNTMLFGGGPSSIIQLGPDVDMMGVANYGFSNGRSPNKNIVLSNFAIRGNRLTPPGAFTSRGNLWSSGKAVPAGMYAMTVNTSNPNVYLCTVGGTTGVSSPTATSGDIVDGTAHWQYVEPLWSNGSCVVLSNCSASTMDRLYISMGMRGAIIESCDNCTMQACQVTDVNKNCVYFSGGNYNVCVGNSFQKSFGGIALANLWNSTITANTNQFMANYGITMGRDAWFNRVIGNVGGLFTTAVESITGTVHGKTYALPYGAYSYGFYHCNVSHNQFLYMEVLFSDNNTFTGNACVGGEGNAILVKGSSSNTFYANEVYNFGKVGATAWAFVSQTIPASWLGTSQAATQSKNNVYVFNRVVDDRNIGLAGIGFDFLDITTGNVVAFNDVTIDQSSPDALYYNITSDQGEFYNNRKNGTARFLLPTLPTAGLLYRGQVIVTPGASGVADVASVCLKDAANAYAFHAITTA